VVEGCERFCPADERAQVEEFSLSLARKNKRAA
jgi:hypothetical protein